MGMEWNLQSQEGLTVKHKIYLILDLGNFIDQLWSAPTLDIGLRTQNLPSMPRRHALPPTSPT